MDIHKIFNSKARKALFRLYFTNPEQDYYLRELERLLKIPVAMLRRELINLEKSGIFTSHRKANLVFYHLNKQYPLFGELKSIVFKTVGVEGALQDALRNLNIDCAFLYGSFAKNVAGLNSDIDLCVIGTPNEEILITVLNQQEKILMREINYTIYSRAEFEKQRKVSGSFLNQVLKEKVIILKGSLCV